MLEPAALASCEATLLDAAQMPSELHSCQIFLLCRRFIVFVALVQGVRLAYFNFEADVLLLTMTNVIPDHFEPYELGFDASQDAVPKQAIGIHHPGGVPTAISTVEAGCVKAQEHGILWKSGALGLFQDEANSQSSAACRREETSLMDKYTCNCHL